jgi:DNA-binding NarL/FixJ family response regulator
MFKILVIDPNAAFRQSLKKLIVDRFPHIEIQEADTASEGLNKLAMFAPQLIFIDICLPDQSGLDLARKIKASQPELIILIFASYDLPEYQTAAIESGADCLIPKDDWTGEDILRWVESIFSDAKKSNKAKIDDN